MARLFVGTFLPHVYQDKVRLLQENNEHLHDLWQRRLRWVKPTKLHLTWIFLGQVDDSKTAIVQSCLEKMFETTSGRKLTNRQPDKVPLQLTYDQPEVWPNLRRARQIVLTPKVIPMEVLAVANSIRTVLAPFIEKMEEKEKKKKFKPHLTLLRLDNDRLRRSRHSILKACLRAVSLADINSLSKLLPIVHDLSSISLMESHVGSESDEYEVIKDFPLN